MYFEDGSSIDSKVLLQDLVLRLGLFETDTRSFNVILMHTLDHSVLDSDSKSYLMLYLASLIDKTYGDSQPKLVEVFFQLVFALIEFNFVPRGNDFKLDDVHFRAFQFHVTNALRASQIFYSDFDVMRDLLIIRIMRLYNSLFHQLQVK